MQQRIIFASKFPGILSWPDLTLGDHDFDKLGFGGVISRGVRNVMILDVKSRRQDDIFLVGYSVTEGQIFFITVDTLTIYCLCLRSN